MKSGQIIAIASAVVLTGLLFIAPRTVERNEQAATTSVEEGHDHDHDHEGEEGAEDLDAKVQKAVEIIQSGEQPPMVAIGMLREVLEEDPQNLGALYWMGEFSMMSGQFDKAEGRFQTMLAIDPANALAAKKLAEVYVATDRVPQAIELLENFVGEHTNQSGTEELKAYLAEIREQ